MKSTILLAIAMLAAGCVTQGETVRSGEQVQREQTVRGGVVEGAREVQIEAPRPTGAGGIIGAVLGGVAGSYIGSGRGTIIGSVLGSVAGGIAGNAAEQAASRQTGIELTIRLDDGRTVVIAQPAGTDAFRPGERVQVVSDGATARVTR